jgi:outer membrane protein assembly factor BamD (BamD/ComL family)
MNFINKFHLLLIFGLVTLTAAQARASVFPDIPAANQSVPGIEDTVLDQSKEMLQFFKAKESLFKQDWENAKAGLEQYLLDYPAGRLADEALYWTAQCLNRISKAEKDAGRMIAFREEAVKRLNELIERFGTSLWVNDALALRTEISRDLDYFGLTEYRVYLNAAEEEKRQTDRHLRVLRSLEELTKEAALPFLQKILTTDNSQPVRFAALSLFAKNYKDRAIPFLEMIATTDPDDNVRKEAASIVRGIRMGLISVRLNSYEFASSLAGSSELVRIQENSINLFELPHEAPGENKAEEAIRLYFGNNIGPVKSFNYPGRDLDYFGTYSDFSVGFGDSFFFNIVNPDLTKELSRISGTIRIGDLITKSKYERPFMVDSQHDDLVVMRRGENLVMMLLQFEVYAESQPQPSREKLSKLLNSPVMRTTFMNLLGCVVTSSAIVQTTRSRTESDFLDLGPARAEIPGLGGTWVLEGQLLCCQKSRIFIGRQFILTDPQGKVAAKGALVEVPADSPQSYRVK